MNPQNVTISVKDGEAFNVPAGDNLFRTLRAARVFIPTICGGNGFCGQCRVKVLSGADSPVTEKETKKLTADELAAGWRLSCQVIVDNNMALELPSETKDVRLFTATASELEMVNHDTRRVRLELVSPPAIKFLPGAFILLDIPPCPAATRGVSRTYSIATPPSTQNAIELNVKLVPNGIGTGFVHDTLKPGDTVTFTGPYSGYADATDDNELICVAGGSGMSPVLSILRHLNEIKSTRKVTYFFGAKTRADLFYMDELRALEKSLANFSFVPVIEKPTDADKDRFQTGLVTEAIARLVANASTASAYLCGGPGMLGACSAVLTNASISKEKIFFDKFS